MHTYTHTYILTYIYKCAYTYTYIHAYIRTRCAMFSVQMNLYEWMPVSTLEAIPRKKRGALISTDKNITRAILISTGKNMARGGLISTGNIARVFELG